LIDQLPIGLQNWLRRTRDSAALKRQPRTACDPSHLRTLQEGEIAGFLAQHEAAGAWPAVEHEIAALGITDRADGVNPGDRRALYYLVRALRPARVLEVGTHIGASTAHIAAGLRDNARNGAPAARITSVDIEDVNDPVAGPWRRHGSPHSPAQLLERLDMASSSRFVTQSSLAFLRETRDTWDFIFLDGDHRGATVYQEVPAALARLEPGGFLLLHDYFPAGGSLWPSDPVIPGVWHAIERLRSEGVGLKALPLGNLPWPTKLGRSVTSLAAVTKTG